MTTTMPLPPSFIPVPPPPEGAIGTQRGAPGQRLVGKTLWDVWPRLLGEVVRHGAVSGAAYGHQQKELLAVTWTFDAKATLDESGAGVPQWLTDLPEIGQSASALDAYADVHFLGTGPRPAGVDYVYADLLQSRWDNQIARCVVVLKEEPEQRRAVAVTWDTGLPAGRIRSDGTFDPRSEAGGWRFPTPSAAASKNPPCLTHLWFRRDADGSLFTHATFRSHDLYRAGVPNAWGLCRLAEHVAGQLDWPLGKLCIVSLSAHCYEDCWAAAEDLAATRGRGVYEEDERAILRVRLGDGRPDGGMTDSNIAVDLLDAEGCTLRTITGATPEQAERRVLRAGWVTTLSHAAWLGRELQRQAR